MTNLDSLGTYEEPKCPYVDPITDLNTAQLDEAGYKAEILRRYKERIIGPVADQGIAGSGGVSGSGTAGSGSAPRTQTQSTASTAVPVPTPYPAWGAALLDTEGDQRAEYLVVNAPFTAAAAGQYVFAAQLQAPDGTPLADVSLAAELAAGSYQIPLHFPGAAVAAAGLDGPYTVVDFYWRGPDGWGEAEEPYTTPAYTAGQFTPPVAAFTQPTAMAAVAVDPYRTDLELTAHLQVHRPGTYQVGAAVLDAHGAVIATAQDRQELATGPGLPHGPRSLHGHGRYGRRPDPPHRPGP